MVLKGLDHLHTKCRVIHPGTQQASTEFSLRHGNDSVAVDLKPDNILLGIENQAVIDDLVNDETEEPTPRNVEGSRAIYLSRNFGDLQKLRILGWLSGKMFLSPTIFLFRLISSKPRRSSYELVGPTVSTYGISEL